MACGEARDRQPGYWRTVNGGGLRAGKLQAGIGTSQGQQRKPWRGWDDRPRIARVSETTLAGHSGTVVERDLCAATGEAGGNPQAGRRRREKTRHSFGAGSIHSAGGDAGSATQVGPDVFRTQLWVSSWAIGSSGGGSGTEVYRRRISLVRGLGFGEILRPGFARQTDGQDCRRDQRQAVVEADPGVSHGGSNGRRAGESGR